MYCLGFGNTYLQVTTHLSHHTNIFGFDGAVGSYKDDRSRVRVITDSPIVALFAQNILVC
jgi:ATP-dependent phosphoenolpyruvate carboxykinase